MKPKYHILICDDEQEIIDILKLYLDADEYEIYEANDGLRGWKIIQQNQIDLAIVDIMMPEMSGIQLIKRAKTEYDLPFLILSAKTRLEERLLGYEVGAEDYISKPFEPLEVVAKVKVHLKSESQSRVIEVADLILDLDQAELIRSGVPYPLTHVEFEVLKLLMESPNRIFTKAQIYQRGWGEEYMADDNSLRVIINRLREKVGSDCIQTVRGIGYRIRL